MLFFAKNKEKKDQPTEKLIFSLAEVNIENIPLVGDKVVGVARLARTDVPVPPGFVLSTRFYDYFMEENGLKDYVKKELDHLMVNKTDANIRKFSQNVQEKILKAKFPDYLKMQIKKAYSRLSGFTESWVAVRSSLPTDMGKDDELVGKLFTELNVKGNRDLDDAVKKSFASLFSLGFVEYALANSINPEKLQIAVLVQKMIQAEVSGVLFTIDPVTNDRSSLAIEAVYGLGDTIGSGAITPDQYTVQKADNRIRDRRIVPQEWMHILRADNKSLQNDKVRISEAWQAKQKLADTKILELAEIGTYVENFMKRPQDIEWVIPNTRLLTREDLLMTLKKLQCLPMKKCGPVDRLTKSILMELRLVLP
jgi:pyruvate,water dikinase